MWVLIALCGLLLCADVRRMPARRRLRVLAALIGALALLLLALGAALPYAATLAEPP